MNNQDNAENEGWILTHTGIKFHPFSSRCPDFSIRDIAHSLSLQCRWNGHTREFYSVAQHCIETSWACHSRFRREALLHDATEAYISDVPRPVKAMLPEFKAQEDALMERIFRCYGLQFPLPGDVHRVDYLMLIVEARDLFDDGRAVQLFGDAGVRSVGGLSKLVPMSPAQAEQAFLYRAAVLGFDVSK